jgi:hypothetical protein
MGFYCPTAAPFSLLISPCVEESRTNRTNKRKNKDNKDNKDNRQHVFSQGFIRYCKRPVDKSDAEATLKLP